ncbi:MAG: chemotaxis protein CheX [Bacteroides sp.]
MEINMADINVECINPFLMATTSIMRDMCQMEMKIGKPYVKQTEFKDDSVLIMIGVTGEMRGQVILAFTIGSALKIVSKMAMMEMTEMDELATSAISELGNMIMGNAATILSTKGIGIDITPPTFCNGTFTMSTSYTKNVCIPLTIDDELIMELDISVKSEE